MSNKPVPEEILTFFRHLAEFLADPEGLDDDEIKETLRAEGVDPERLTVRVQQLVTSKLDEHRLAWQVRARKQRLAALDLLKCFRTDVPHSREELEDMVSKALVGLLGPKARVQVQAYFKKFEEATDKDLQTLLEDLKRLDIWDDLREGD